MFFKVGPYLGCEGLVLHEGGSGVGGGFLPGSSQQVYYSSRCC